MFTLIFFVLVYTLITGSGGWLQPGDNGIACIFIAPLAMLEILCGLSGDFRN